MATGLRLVTGDIGYNLGSRNKYISAFDTLSNGIMELFLRGVKYDKIKQLGWWRSSEIMMYLHIFFCPLLQSFESIMVDCSNFSQILSPVELDNLRIRIFLSRDFTSERWGTLGHSRVVLIFGFG